MEYLYAPWRGGYIKDKIQLEKTGSCPFCIALESSDDSYHFVLKRFSECALLLNAYPYNPGHLLIIPRAHVDNLEDLTPSARAQIMELTSKAIPVLEQTIKNTGTNIGINLGSRAAGGTIPEHLHVHILPRFEGDTNFLPALAQTKQLSDDLKEVYSILYNAFNNVLV